MAQCDIETITEHALIAWLWSETDYETGQPLDDNYSIEDIAPETLAQWREDVEQFVTIARAALRVSKLSDEQIGHDFTLTRNGHGTGFWDRGLGFTGQALTEHAKSFGDCAAYVSDDGLIRAM